MTKSYLLTISSCAALLLFTNAQNAHNTTTEHCALHIEVPRYVSLARLTAISGDVSLNIDIDEAGTVTEVQILSGHPLLAEEAIQNVKQWVFKPGNPGNLKVDYEFRLVDTADGAKPTSSVVFDLPNRVRLTEPRPIPQPERN